MAIKIYHNSRCSKSRCALDLLNDRKEEFEIIEYLKANLSFQEIEELVNMLGVSPLEIIRKGEADYKDNFKGKELSDKEWIQAMVDYPKLIERPIVVKDGKAAIGRPIEKVVELLDS